MARRSDPWLNAHKSALQKYMRRGLVDEAVGTALAIEQRVGKEALVRRVPVIVAEDIDWRLVGIATDLLLDRGLWAAGSGLQASTAELIASLTARPKDKSGWYLPATVWGGGLVPSVASPKGLIDALRAGHVRDAMAICHAAHLAETFKKAYAPVMFMWEGLPEVSQSIVRTSLARYGLGGVGMNELMAAAVLAIIEQPDALHFEVQRYSGEPSAPDPLDWWTQDTHTIAGSIAAAVAAKQLGVPRDRIAGLWFLFESSLVYPEVPSPWRDQAFALWAAREGYESEAAARVVWEGIRPTVADLVKWKLGKRDLW